MSVDEFDYRELCSDGACTGLIGPSGTCNVCGRAAQGWGDERKRGMRNLTDPPPLVGASSDALQPEAPSTIGGWNSRTLCSDGTCVGVVAENGTCSVCGKAGIIVETPEDDAGEEDDASDDDDEDDASDDDDEDDDDEDDGAFEHDEEDADARAAEDDIEHVAASDEAEPERELCPDGACVGVIGPDGRCRACGQAKSRGKDSA